MYAKDGRIIEIKHFNIVLSFELYICCIYNNIFLLYYIVFNREIISSVAFLLQWIVYARCLSAAFPCYLWNAVQTSVL